MFFDLKPCPFRQLSLNISKVAVGELDDLVTLRAYQVVMVFYCSPNEITSTIACGIDLTDKSQIGKDIQCAVNSS
jgi:hypothetical protein